MSYNPNEMYNTNQKMPSMNNILNEISNSSMHIPSRDIPTQQYPSSQLDPNSNVDFIGKTELDENESYNVPKKTRFAEKEEEEEVYDVDDNIDENGLNNMENIFKLFQMPILIMLLFFIFQLPIIKLWEFQYIPFIFSQDGNWNFMGIIINGMLFTFAYLFLQKLT